MSQNQQNPDAGEEVMYMAFGAIALYLIAQYLFGEQLLAVWLWTRWAWASLITTVVPWDLPMLEEAKFATRAYHPREWDTAHLTTLANSFRGFLVPLFGVPIAWFTYKIWRQNPGNRFRRVHTRDSLVASEVRQWPWIAPIQGLNLIHEPIDKGPWAMGKPPLAFARHYRLLDGKVVNKLRAEKLFASQLGPLWEGPSKLPPHVRALFGCFIAQMCKDRDASHKALADLALTARSGKLNTAASEALLAQYIDRPEVQQLFVKHAYVATVLAAALAAARTVGVLPPNYFLWLRPQSRSLWYMLNCVGRHTPFSEVAGTHGHYLAEKVAGHGIEKPYVSKAVLGLEKALQTIIFDA